MEPDLAMLFPYSESVNHSESVNRALRVLADTARAATPRNAHIHVEENFRLMKSGAACHAQAKSSAPLTLPA